MKFSALFTFLMLFTFGFANAEGSNVVSKTLDELIQKDKEESEDLSKRIETGEKTFNPVPIIMHHIADAHSWHFWGEGENSVAIPLPVILWDDNGLNVFMSSKFHHGESVVESNGNYYILYHEKIYKTDAQGIVSIDDHGHLTNPKPLDFSLS